MWGAWWLQAIWGYIETYPLIAWNFKNKIHILILIFWYSIYVLVCCLSQVKPKLL
jgi:hypothetical protein